MTNNVRTDELLELLAVRTHRAVEIPIADTLELSERCRSPMQPHAASESVTEVAVKSLPAAATAMASGRHFRRPNEF